MSTRLVFVKLGGSILTDKTAAEALDRPALAAAAGALAAALANDSELRLLIGHGGGSFGHYWAKQYATQHGAFDADGWQGVARVSDAMGRLNRAIVAALLEAGIAAIGVQPAASAFASKGVLRSIAVEPIRSMLAADAPRRLVPVIHGDVVLDDVQGAAIVSTESLFAFLAPHLEPQHIVLVGEGGVYTADPRRDPGAVRIGHIGPTNIDAVLEMAGASHGADVTGGMASKVRQMWELVRTTPGLRVQLVGGAPEALAAALRGDEVEGTVIRN